MTFLKKYIVRTFTGVLFAIFLALFSACKYNSNQWVKKKRVVVTTGIVGDAIREILPADYEIHVLMGPGVDPHSYEARPSDIRKLGEAEVIVYSGLHLEGKLTKIFQKLAKEKKVIDFSSGLPRKSLIPVTSKLYDPHVWLDPVLWSKCVRYAGKQLAEFYPMDHQTITESTKLYSENIKSVDQRIRVDFGIFSKEEKVLITSHDAFQYFGKSYGVEVMALQGVSTVSEPGITAVSSLTDLIVKRKIKALFVENSVSPKALKALMESCARQGHTIGLGGELYSDALGGEKSGADTYLKMIQKNAYNLKKGWRNE